MNICITGACGHIGSAFIRNYRLSSFDSVFLVDNLLTQRYASLFHLPKEINYQFFPIDICSKDMESVIRQSDILVHLAAITDAETSFHKPEQVESVNKKGLKKVAELCAKHNCSLVFPSTTSVYGVQKELVDENCSKKDLKPQSPYAESKLYAENVLKVLGKKKNLRSAVLRLGTIFGYSPGMRFHTAVNKFTWQSCLGEGITVWKTALHQKRPYCALQDAIAAFNYVIERDLFDGEIYNIVTTNLAVNDIIELIRKYIPSVAIRFVNSPIMNQLSYNVSNEKSLQKGFGYTGDIAEGIKETIVHLKGLNRSVEKINL